MPYRFRCLIQSAQFNWLRSIGSGLLAQVYWLRSIGSGLLAQVLNSIHSIQSAQFNWLRCLIQSAQFNWLRCLIHINTHLFSIGSDKYFFKFSRYPLKIDLSRHFKKSFLTTLNYF